MSCGSFSKLRRNIYNVFLTLMQHLRRQETLYIQKRIFRKRAGVKRVERTGQMKRFIELYETVYKDMYRLACYYLGNTHDAEDAVQDAALLACENFGKLRNEASFRAWIFKILVNQCRSSRRKNKGREPLPEDCETGYEPSMSSRTEMQELLMNLTEEERLIVTLSVFGGYRGKEIARIIGRNHSTVRSRYRRALKKLEQEIEAETGKEAQR